MTEKRSDVVVVEKEKETQKPGMRSAQESEHKVIVIAKIVYILHGLSILLGLATGASILGSFLFD